MEKIELEKKTIDLCNKYQICFDDLEPIEKVLLYSAVEACNEKDKKFANMHLELLFHFFSNTYAKMKCELGAQKLVNAIKNKKK